VIAAASWIVSGPGPEWIITLLGSVAVIIVARGPLAIPLRIYFGLGTAAYFCMLLWFFDPMPAWYAYQSFRLLAFMAFALVISQRSREWAVSRQRYCRDC
jgi:hypothetical protein